MNYPQLIDCYEGREACHWVSFERFEPIRETRRGVVFHFETKQWEGSLDGSRHLTGTGQIYIQCSKIAPVIFVPKDKGLVGKILHPNNIEWFDENKDAYAEINLYMAACENTDASGNNPNGMVDMAIEMGYNVNPRRQDIFVRNIYDFLRRN